MNEREHNLDRQIDRQDSRLYLDIVKGIAIFLMLWGHCIQYCTNNEFDFFENPVFKFIYSFHMPLFMLVSGYLFAFSCKKRDLKTLLIHRTQGLLQPIIMCTIFNYVLTYVIFSRLPYNILGAGWLNELSSLWFLWSVLASSIIIGIAYKTNKNIVARIIIAILGIIFVSLFPNKDLNVYMYPYFLLGFVFAFIKPKISKVAINIKYFSIIVFPVMLFFFKKKHFIYTTGIINNSYDIFSLISINLYRWIIGLIGSVFVLVLIEWFNVLLKRFRFFGFVGNAISMLGKKSLQIYCLSVSLLSFLLPKVIKVLCDKLGYNVLTMNMIMYDYLLTPLIAICYAIVLYYIVRFFDRIKISKLLFGR